MQNDFAWVYAAGLSFVLEGYSKELYVQALSVTVEAGSNGIVTSYLLETPGLAFGMSPGPLASKSVRIGSRGPWMS